jgi:TonB family protein
LVGPVPADGLDDSRAAPGEFTPAPHRTAGSDPARGEGPLDSRAGPRSFDAIESGPARDARWVRAASDEKHPGLLDLSAVSAPGPQQGVAGRGPAEQPGAVDRVSAGTAPTQPGDDALALGAETSRSAAEQVRTGYELEIRRRVARTLHFPHRLALALEQGETIVAFTVGPDGRLQGTVRLLKSAGFAEFDAEAMSAVAKAAPFPASGRAHAVSMRIPFENPVVRAGTSMVGP